MEALARAEVIVILILVGKRQDSPGFIVEFIEGRAGNRLASLLIELFNEMRTGYAEKDGGVSWVDICRIEDSFQDAENTLIVDKRNWRTGGWHKVVSSGGLIGLNMGATS
jgi:hypothetical protein